MRRATTILPFVALSLTGVVASGDEERGNRVRGSAVVEVIDDAQHVDDIISRMKAQGRREAAPAPVELARPRLERPATPVDSKAATKSEALRPGREAASDRHIESQRERKLEREQQREHRQERRRR